jgi:hypothetical protein
MLTSGGKKKNNIKEKKNKNKEKNNIYLLISRSSHVDLYCILTKITNCTILYNDGKH